MYEPAEDSYLLEKEVKVRANGKRVLDVGTGSGIQARAALDSGAKEVLAVDVNPESVEHCKKKEINAIQSYLFSNISSGKFDLIIFNPPYLPYDSLEDRVSALATSGGKKGDEIIVRFLKDVGDYLSEDGIILLVVSSLTPLGEIGNVLKEKNFVKKVIASEKVFMEELWVWKIRKDYKLQPDM
ncbi:MAG: methyltransferase [Nanoarchaeota archaeon]|nr:methyltransferase [Nanoarchaeota archaeon]MBU1051706.1 methyltransferase [Nanoarchaeota archaeon]MBU1987995.1 methyltransferase [Nanoarchaeota archaeon]